MEARLLIAYIDYLVILSLNSECLTGITYLEVSTVSKLGPWLWITTKREKAKCKHVKLPSLTKLFKIMKCICIYCRI